MDRFFFFGVLFLVCLSCKERKPQVVADDTSKYKITADEWPKRLEINQKAQVIVKEWVEFNALETNFDVLYTVENREDLNLIIEDLIEKQNVVADSKYPVEFDIPQVKSRQKVFKTYMLKVKGDLFYRVDPQESIVQMIEAYNAFRNQFNVVVNNTLDTNLILEE